jgi:hypothetical protein
MFAWQENQRDARSYAIFACVKIIYILAAGCADNSTSF